MSEQIGKLSDLKKDPLYKEKKDKPLLVSIDQAIVKVTGQTTKTYIGYDVFSEILIEVEKEKCAHIPSWINNLLSDKVARFNLALSITDNSATDAAKLLKTNEREMYRFKASRLIKK